MYSKEAIKELRLKFWNDFKSYQKTSPELNYKKKRWMLNETGVRGIAFRFDVDRNSARVILELQHKHEDRRLKTFEILERYKAVMDEGFENGLVWEYYHQREDNSQEVCRIYTQLENVDWHRQNQWPEIYIFFIRKMLQMEENFVLLKDSLMDELRND